MHPLGYSNEIPRRRTTTLAGTLWPPGYAVPHSVRYKAKSWICAICAAGSAITWTCCTPALAVGAREGRRLLTWRTLVHTPPRGCYAMPGTLRPRKGMTSLIFVCVGSVLHGFVRIFLHKLFVNPGWWETLAGFLIGFLIGVLTEPKFNNNI